MKPSFETSIDVTKCADFLRERHAATYSELNRHIGRRVEREDRHVLQSARRILEREGIIFICERAHGVKRASNGEVAKLSTDYPITKISRITKRAKRRELHVNIQSLSAEDRLAFAIGRAVLQGIGGQTLKSFRSRIGKEIEKRDGELVTVQSLISLPRLKGTRK
jgi:hypothetical protein